MNKLRFRNIYLLNALLWLSILLICLFIRPVFRNMTGIYLIFCIMPLLLALLYLLFSRLYPSSPPNYIRLVSMSLNIFMIIFLMWISKPLWRFYSLLNFTFFMIILYFTTYYYKPRFREVLVFGLLIQISLLLYFPVFAWYTLIEVNSLTIIYYALQNSIFFIFFFLIALEEYFSRKKFSVNNDISESEAEDIRTEEKNNDAGFYSKIIDLYLSGFDAKNTGILYHKINQILEKLGKKCHADRAYLFELDSDRTHMNNTVEWSIDHTMSQQEHLQNNPVSDFPWWMNKLYNNEDVYIESVRTLPAEAIHEKEILEKQGILSLIVIGLYSHDKLSGFIGVDFVNPINKAKLEYIRFLNIAGHFINELLQKKKTKSTILSKIKTRYSDIITSEIVLNSVDSLLENIPCILIDHSYEIIGMNAKGKELLAPGNSVDEDLIFHKSKNTQWTNLVGSLKNNFQRNPSNALIPDYIFEKNKTVYSVYYFTIFFQENRSVILLTFHDITPRYETRIDLVREVEEKKRMLSEIHHRVKNNMQIISNFMDLENLKINSGNALSIFNDTRDRIKSLAILHEKLYESREFGKTNLSVYLKELAENIILVLSNYKNIELRYSGEDRIIASFDTAVTCGLLVNEIIVNSLKHAYPDRNEGYISLDLSKDQHEIVLIIKDNGSGFDRIALKNSKTTLGLRLIDGFVRELNGSYELLIQNGTHFIIRFPEPYKE